MRPLPDIDLARIAVLQPSLRQKALEQIRYGRPPLSFGPVRSCYADIFNIQSELLGPVGPTPWRVIERRLRRACRSEEELTANLRVARGLHEYAESTNIIGRSHEFFPFAISAMHKVRYWLPMVLVIDDQPMVPFIDPRRSRGLTTAGRRFVFSVMHERIRAADPDFNSARFGIIQFGEPDGERRAPLIHTDEGIDLFRISEMEQMVAETYSLWRDICEEREAEQRRQGTGTGGSLI